MDFLSKNGLFIFQELEKHCRENLKVMDVDKFELAMLANAFDKYQLCAKYCLENGDTYEMATKTGIYPMIRPEYTVMNKEAQHILKHSAKFGLNPADRERFKSLKRDDDKGKKGFDLGKMKVAK